MRTADLTGALLDYWVARAQDIKVEIKNLNQPAHARVWALDAHGRADGRFCPSTSWAQGGPIIEREHIHLSPPTARVHRNGGPNAGWGEAGVWTATTWHKGANGRRALAWDTDSALVAAMRCYVASKFGNEVEDTASQEAAEQKEGGA